MREWNVVVVPCPNCGEQEKHPTEEQTEILAECYKCGEKFIVRRR